MGPRECLQTKELQNGDFDIPWKKLWEDDQGFLQDWRDWDEEYAADKAREMKLSGGLMVEHLRILRYLQSRFQGTGVVPTVIECCKANGLELEELEALSPDGYHRGSVKIAGLCVQPGK